MYKTDKKNTKRKMCYLKTNNAGNSGNVNVWLSTVNYSIDSFSTSKTVYYCKSTCNVLYSFSPYIVGELTGNHLTGFYYIIFTVFYRKCIVFFFFFFFVNTGVMMLKMQLCITGIDLFKMY